MVTTRSIDCDSFVAECGRRVHFPVRNMCRLAYLAANRVLCVRECFTRCVLAPEALAEGASTELVYRS